MHAEGDVVRLPEWSTEAPRDFSVFFAEESRRLFEALYSVTGNRGPQASGN